MITENCGIETDADGKELVSHGTPEFPIAIYQEVFELCDVGWHWHDEFELAYVLEGEGIFSFSGEKRILTAGDGFFANSGSLHGAWNTNTKHCIICSLVFHPYLVAGSLDSIFWTKYIKVLVDNKVYKGCFLEMEENAELANLIFTAWQVCSEKMGGFEFKVRNILSDILYQLYSAMPQRKSIVSEQELRDSARIKVLLNFIQKHYSEGIKISEVAAAASISESECLRCFKKMLGISPGKYIRNYRVQKAYELLKNTELPIGEIGDVCGFTDESYFVKVFRETNGVTPGQIRVLSKKKIPLLQ